MKRCRKSFPVHILPQNTYLPLITLTSAKTTLFEAPTSDSVPICSAVSNTSRRAKNSITFHHSFVRHAPVRRWFTLAMPSTLKDG